MGQNINNDFDPLSEPFCGMNIPEIGFGFVFQLRFKILNIIQVLSLYYKLPTTGNSFQIIYDAFVSCLIILVYMFLLFSVSSVLSVAFYFFGSGRRPGCVLCGRRIGLVFSNSSWPRSCTSTLDVPCSIFDIPTLFAFCLSCSSFYPVYPVILSPVFCFLSFTRAKDAPP